MLARSVSLLFEFIESRVFFEVLDIGGEICFLFVYFFFLDSACGGLGRDRFRENSGFAALQFWISIGFALGRITTEDCGHVHLMQTLLLTIPFIGTSVGLNLGLA